MSERRAGLDLWSRVGFGVLILLVLVLVVVVRPGGSDDSGSPDEGSRSPTAIGPTGAPASDEEFCRGFRELADAQAAYAATPDDGSAEDLVREAADALVAMGPPESMPIEARGGLYTLVSGVYGSLGETLPPGAVPGAADGQQVAGSDQAFGAWLTDNCPA